MGRGCKYVTGTMLPVQSDLPTIHMCAKPFGQSGISRQNEFVLDICLPPNISDWMLWVRHLHLPCMQVQVSGSQKRTSREGGSLLFYKCTIA
jgi:hypothetical protein